MADQGAIARTRAFPTRRLTDYQISPADPSPRASLVGHRRMTDFQLAPPTPFTATPKATAYLRQVWPPEFQENYWTRPLVLDGRRAQLLFPAGSDGLFRLQTATKTARGALGWRWNGPWSERLRLSVTAGHNTLTVQVYQSTDRQPRPTVRLLEAAALGILEQAQEAGPGAGETKTIAMGFFANRAGVTTIRLEWGLFVENEYCEWVGIDISN